CGEDRRARDRAQRVRRLLEGGGGREGVGQAQPDASRDRHGEEVLGRGRDRARLRPPSDDRAGHPGEERGERDARYPRWSITPRSDSIVISGRGLFPLCWRATRSPRSPAASAPTTASPYVSPTWIASCGATPHARSAGAKIRGSGFLCPTIAEMTVASIRAASPRSDRMCRSRLLQFDTMPTRTPRSRSFRSVSSTSG